MIKLIPGHILRVRIKKGIINHTYNTFGRVEINETQVHFLT